MPLDEPGYAFADERGNTAAEKVRRLRRVVPGQRPISTGRVTAHKGRHITFVARVHAANGIQVRRRTMC